MEIGLGDRWVGGMGGFGNGDGLAMEMGWGGSWVGGGTWIWGRRWVWGERLFNEGRFLEGNVLGDGDRRGGFGVRWFLGWIYVGEGYGLYEGDGFGDRDGFGEGEEIAMGMGWG